MELLAIYPLMFPYEDGYYKNRVRGGVRTFFVHTAFVTRFRALKVTLRESTGQCGSLDTKIIEIGPRSSENGPFEV